MYLTRSTQRTMLFRTGLIRQRIAGRVPISARALSTSSASKLPISPGFMQLGLLVATLGVTYATIYRYTCKGPKGKSCNCNDNKTSESAAA